MLKFFMKDDNISNDKVIKEINFLINKQIKKGFKKFHRLYPLLLN